MSKFEKSMKILPHENLIYSKNIWLDFESLISIQLW